MRSTSLLAALAVLVVLAPTLPASPGPVVEVARRTLLTVPVGPGGIAPWSEGQPGEGIPTSFCFDARGRVHLLVPHDRAVLVCSPGTGEVTRVPLTTREGSPLGAAPFLADMALDGRGHYFVLDTNGGTILHFDPTGRAVASFGHILGGDRIEAEADGTLTVRDAADGALDRFSAEGRFLGFVRDPALSPIVDPSGRYVRAVVMGRRRAFLWLRDRASSVARLLAVVDPRDAGSLLYEAEPLGYDADGALHVLTTEKRLDLSYVSHVYRYAPSGSLTDVYRLPATMEFASGLPRFYRLLPDGTAVTFATTPTSYSLVGYAPPTPR